MSAAKELEDRARIHGGTVAPGVVRWELDNRVTVVPELVPDAPDWALQLYRERIGSMLTGHCLLCGVYAVPAPSKVEAELPEWKGAYLEHDETCPLRTVSFDEWYDPRAEEYGE